MTYIIAPTLLYAEYCKSKRIKVASIPAIYPVAAKHLNFKDYGS